MKTFLLPLLFVAILSTAFAACCGHPSGPHTQPVATPNTTVINLPSQTLTFHPSRNDLTVGCVLFSLISSDQKSVRVNGAPAPEYFHFLPSSTNRVEIPALKIEFVDRPDRVLCMSIKVWFHQVTNQFDGRLYQKLDDRYALIAWSSRPLEPFSRTMYTTRFAKNHVDDFEQFRQFLAKPIAINLNDLPIQEEWGRYPMNDLARNRIADEDLNKIAKILRDRSEKYIIKISAPDPTHAQAILGDQSVYHGTRACNLSRSANGWQIDSFHPIDMVWPS